MLIIEIILKQICILIILLIKTGFKSNKQLGNTKKLNFNLAFLVD